MLVSFSSWNCIALPAVVLTVLTNHHKWHQHCPIIPLALVQVFIADFGLELAANFTEIGTVSVHCTEVMLMMTKWQEIFQNSWLQLNLASAYKLVSSKVDHSGAEGEGRGRAYSSPTFTLPAKSQYVCHQFTWKLKDSVALLKLVQFSFLAHVTVFLDLCIYDI